MAKKKSAAEQAINSVENNTRNSRAKRPVYFYAIPAGVEMEVVEMPGEDWNQKEAESKLKAKLGNDCQIIGPNYKVRGVKSDSNPITVKVNLRDLELTSDKFHGVHDNWKFFANGIAACEAQGESFEDNDLLQIQFEGRADETVKTPKPRIGRTLVRRSALEEVNKL